MAQFFLRLPPCPAALGTGSENDWMTHLKGGLLAAFVHDEPLLRSIDAAFGCDVRLLDETLDQFSELLERSALGRWGRSRCKVGAHCEAGAPQRYMATE